MSNKKEPQLAIPLPLEERVRQLEEQVAYLMERAPRKNFIKPTYDQVFAEMEKYLFKNFGPNVQRSDVEEQTNLFIDHYNSNGWKVGTVPMKSWQSTISGTWMKNLKTKRFDGKINNGNFGHQPVGQYRNNSRGFGAL